ncbi:LysR family transcriptional regulator [Aminobacter ciceronei]|uniref:LysR family glycine cleavage system transcriptional activator n=1 Tax=Aminobacter ciceronei TaxID=150723 RepID=A0ABR6CH57_9HYPH|nr:LysR family transcriptional regulator [Aminobacter ciceronei]MBA8910100.1 LysR family glycine cleavage system transcriptional activator [Aminobacter ciceronei]MBA9023895.1 LysR family glycine cleavage system transcriptional activator [Aminobacter ciceronei]WMC95695.1 LysR family transcriptional regulator [Aminobacter aminovorans]
MQQGSRLPPLQTLRAMAAVARTRSFTKAGEELGLTQTAISHQIAQLEAWLGTPLFVRSRKGVELTVLADKAIPDIVAALSALEAVLETARPSLRSEQLSISTTPEFASQWLQPRLGGFCVAHPEIDVSVTIEYRRARFDIDKIGVAIWLAGTLPGTEAFRLTEDYEFAVSSPAVARALPSRQALRAAPLLRYEGARHTVLDWERWHGQIYDGKEQFPAVDGVEGPFDFQAGPSFPTFSDMIAACRQDAGLALVRSSLVADDLAAGRLVKCFDEIIPSDLQYHLVTSPAQRRSPGVIAFRKWIIQQMTG